MYNVSADTEAAQWVPLRTDQFGLEDRIPRTKLSAHRFLEKTTK